MSPGGAVARGIAFSTHALCPTRTLSTTRVVQFSHRTQRCVFPVLRGECEGAVDARRRCCGGGGGALCARAWMPVSLSLAPL